VIATSADVLDEAFELAGSHHLAGWDSLVLAAAAKAGCRYLLSEDLHDGFAWRGVSLVNPFAARPLPAPRRAARETRPAVVPSGPHAYNRATLSRSALPMTDTELSDIASAATTGLSRMP